MPESKSIVWVVFALAVTVREVSLPFTLACNNFTLLLFPAFMVRVDVNAL